jgi:alanyl-tRNA synthetase
MLKLKPAVAFLDKGQLASAWKMLDNGDSGGRPNPDQAGGRDASKLDEAIAAAKTQLKGAIR